MWHFVRFVLLTAVLLMLSACNIAYFMKEDFTRTSKTYGRMLRWQEFDSALAYVDAPFRDDYRKRIEAAKGIKVVDMRVLSEECLAEQKKAEVTMELDYYVDPSTTIKTVKDLQKWRYQEDTGQKGWRLETLLPEFK